MVAKAPSPSGARLRPETGEIVTVPSAYVDSEGNPFPDEHFVLADLSFFEKHELVGRLASTLDELLMRGVNLLGMLDEIGVQVDDPESVRGFADRVRSDGVESVTRELVQIVLRLLSMAPDLMEDMFLICMKVNPLEREYHRPTVRRMPDDQAFHVLDRIIKLNGEHFVDFFTRYFRFFEPLMQKLQEPSEDLEEPTEEEETAPSGEESSPQQSD